LAASHFLYCDGDGFETIGSAHLDSDGAQHRCAFPRARRELACSKRARVQARALLQRVPLRTSARECLLAIVIQRTQRVRAINLLQL